MQPLFSSTHSVSGGSSPRWSLPTRIAFRFAFVYFVLYIFLTQMLDSLILLPVIDVPEFGTLWPMRNLIAWTATHVFHHKEALVFTGSGSGDKTFDWVEIFCFLVITTLVVAGWSFLDRERLHYQTLYKWFYLFIRLSLGTTMFSYGFIKMIPLQMPFPYLDRLVEPYGNLSPMGVLWASMGASAAYEIFAGLAENLGAILVFIPRTTTLGALICFADMIQVFVLNMTYDVPAKIYSFHLILMSLILLAPAFSRFTDFFLRNRPAQPPKSFPPFHTPRANRIALLLQLAFMIYLIGLNLYQTQRDWKSYGGGAPRSALYGIWNVNEFAVDGQPRPPLLTDNSRWRRLIFEFPDSASSQTMDDAFVRYTAALDLNRNSLSLTEVDRKEPSAKFTFRRISPNQLLFDGQLGGHSVHMQLQLQDRQKFLLVQRGFHWVQEYPFNR